MSKIITPVEGIDFHDTYAHVSKLVIVHLLCPIVATKNWSLSPLMSTILFSEEISMKSLNETHFQIFSQGRESCMQIK